MFIFKYINDVLFFMDNSVNDIYEILKSNDNSLNKIIRHYKIIRKKDNDNIHRNFFDSSEYIFDEYNNTDIIIKYDDRETKEISQHPDNYNNLYNDDGFDTSNIYRDDVIEFSKYNSIESFKQDLQETKTNANINYVNDLNIPINNYDNGNEEQKEFGDSIKNIINNYNDNLYIRFAPPVNKKRQQVKRMLSKYNLYTKYNDNVWLDYLAEDAEMPIFNDNLVYSESKCNYVNKLINDKFNSNLEL